MFIPIIYNIQRYLLKIVFYRKHKKADINKIPENTPYCYNYHNMRCPYYRGGKERKYVDSWCVYMNDTEGICLWDMCKMCGVSEGME